MTFVARRRLTSSPVLFNMSANAHTSSTAASLPRVAMPSLPTCRHDAEAWNKFDHPTQRAEAAWRP